MDTNLLFLGNNDPRQKQLLQNTIQCYLRRSELIKEQRRILPRLSPARQNSQKF